jgi:hypothetical protein
LSTHVGQADFLPAALTCLCIAQQVIRERPYTTQ